MPFLLLSDVICILSAVNHKVKQFIYIFLLRSDDLQLRNVTV